MEQLPKIVRRGLEKTQRPGNHPDANLLVAYAEKSLTDREGAHVLQHLAECADCRDVVSLAMPAIEPAPPIQERSHWLSWPILRWGALAACVVVVGAAVTLHYDRRDTSAPNSVETPAAPADLTAQTNFPQPSAEKLAEKAAPPSPFQSGRDAGSAAGKLSKELGQHARSEATASQAVAPPPSSLSQNQNADEVAANRLGTADAAKSFNAPAKLVGALAAGVPAASPAAAPPRLEIQNKDKSRDDAAAETTIMTAGNVSAPAARTVQPAEGKAQDESSAEVSQDDGLQKNESHKKESQSAPSLADRKMAARKMDTLSARASTATAQYEVRSTTGNKIAFRWTLSGDGEVQRTLDSGKNWQTIPVASNVVFRTLSANDSEIWVGGNAGALYHSSDAGQHWTQVKPVANGRALSGDIVTVEFSDAQHGKLTTSNHETWTTDDAGNGWQSR